MKMVTSKNSVAAFLITAFIIQSAIAGHTSDCQCTRLANVTTIGLDIGHQGLVQEDVGRCQDCDRNKTSTEEIIDGDVCVPTEYRSDSYPMAGRSKYRDTIQQCGYRSTSIDCHRAPLHETFFNGTSYQRRVDIGSCLGVCGINGRECKAIDTAMVAIKGPNGDGEIVVPVIKTCGCVSPGCHRAVFREVFKRKSKEGWIQEEKDVGMCVGTGCPRVCSTCFFEGTKLCDRYCMIYRNGACIATNYTTEAVYTGDLKRKLIHLIKECGCAE